jgi:hypothetical protein
MIRGNISGPLSINIERDDFIAAASLFSPGCGVAQARNRRLLFVALIRIDITIASPLGAKHVLEDSGLEFSAQRCVWPIHLRYV